MALSNTVKSLAEEDIKMDMTPLIDMTFLLLIFFMCTLNFKAMEGMLPSYLPKDIGVFGGAARSSPVEPIRVKLIKSNAGVEVWMGGQQFMGTPEQKYAFLANEIEAQVLRIQQISNEEKMPVILEPEVTVPFQDVVHVLNACLKVQRTPYGKNLEIRFSAKSFRE